MITILALSWQHILILFLILVLIIVHFIPTIIAYSRKKTNFWAIFAINLLLGWSLIGWVVALVWALSNKENTQQIIINSQTPQNQQTNFDQLAKLKELHEKGVINDQEFESQKNKLLN